MAWNIAGVGRRTRDAAVEAARRAGMRLDDWLDEAITDYTGLDQLAQSEDDEAYGDRLDAAAGRLDRIARRNAPAQAPRAPGTANSFNSAIERFEMRLSRAEAQAARAFETVAQILERDDDARDSDRRALIDAVRRLELDPDELDRACSDRREAQRAFFSAAWARSEAAIRSQVRGVADRHAPPRDRGPPGPQRGRAAATGPANGRRRRRHVRAFPSRARSGPIRHQFGNRRRRS